MPACGSASPRGVHVRAAAAAARPPGFALSCAEALPAAGGRERTTESDGDGRPEAGLDLFLGQNRTNRGDGDA
jgi:hypothetical protein